MKKVLFISSLVVLAGCASTSDFEQLQDRVNLIESSQNQLAQHVKKCDNTLSELALKSEKCVLHCKAIDSKLDKVFKKSQYK